MDYNKLIEQLRTTESRSKRATLDSAAAAIETLMEERDTAMGFIKRYCECEQCIHAQTPHPDCRDDCDCEYCTSKTCVCCQCRDMDKWEWKGLERECE